jgi:hypothetical protein
MTSTLFADQEHGHQPCDKRGLRRAWVFADFNGAPIASTGHTPLVYNHPTAKGRFKRTIRG